MLWYRGAVVDVAQEDERQGMTGPCWADVTGGRQVERRPKRRYV
jgi:hypothetical protein